MGITNTTWKYIRRSPYQAISAIITMFLTFLMGGFFALATIASVFILQYFESKPQITVFFSDSATEKNIGDLETALKKSEKLSSVKFISKQQALEIYRTQNKNDPLLLEMVTADILPSSLEISATSPQHLAGLAEIISGAEGVEEVVYQKDVVNSLISWTNAIRNLGLLLAGILAFDSLLIIITVIGMKIAMRRKEVEILKLVGASTWYIRLPFILEGITYGQIGAFGAWVFLIVLILVFREFILSFLGIIPVVNQLLLNPADIGSIFTGGLFLIILLFLGTTLGTFGSLIAIGRYLKH